MAGIPFQSALIFAVALFAAPGTFAGEEDTLAIPIRTQDRLSAAEQKEIQAYTREDKVESTAVFLHGIEKLPPSKGIYFHGSAEKFREGDELTLDKFWSISTDRRIGESFTDPNGSLLEINATSARSIERYSVVAFEKEYILLPNTRLRVDSISKARIQFSGHAFVVPLVHLTELDPDQ